MDQRQNITKAFFKYICPSMLSMLLVGFYGIVFQVIGAGIPPVIKNLGKPIFAMIAMITGMFTNIILDAFFYLYLIWG